MDDGLTPLYIACQNGHKDVADLLLQAGADKDKAFGNGRTPLYIASQKGQKDIVELLLRAGADKDKAQKDGATPLFIASQMGHNDIVELLRRAGADENKALLFDYFSALPTAHSLQALVANNFQAIPKPRPPLQKLQHSAIHVAIALLQNDRQAALPVARHILSTFPSDHPTLPLLRNHVQPQQPAPGPAHLPEELRAKLIAELIDEDQAPKKKKNGKKK